MRDASTVCGRWWAVAAVWAAACAPVIAADPPPFVLDLTLMGRPKDEFGRRSIPGEPTVLLFLETAGGKEDITYAFPLLAQNNVEGWADAIAKALRRVDWKAEVSADLTRVIIYGRQPAGGKLDPVVQAGAAARDLAPGGLGPVVTGPKGRVLHLVRPADGKPVEWVPIDPD